MTGQVTGISFDGGYAQYMIAPASAVARFPADLPATDAAPLLCAGVTTFNALSNSGARGGDVVAILGLGGLGHLAVQYAAKMGFLTVAIARGKDKEPLAKQLGAQVYIDSQAGNPSAELLKLGGARVILATVTAGRRHECRSRRAGNLRHADHHRRRQLDGNLARAHADGQSIGQRLVLGHVNRFARHAGLQRRAAASTR